AAKTRLTFYHRFSFFILMLGPSFFDFYLMLRASFLVLEFSFGAYLLVLVFYLIFVSWFLEIKSANLQLMIIKSATYLISNPDFKQCPKPDRPEYAFIGRSNVGKSSLINMITNNERLAKTSGTPGKTQLLNHFLINKEWSIVARV